MAFQKHIVNLAVFIAVISVFVSQIHCSPVVPASVTDEDVPTMREGRQFGLASSQASAVATAGATGLGYPGFGGASANAFAAANANSFGGYPYGRK